MVDFISGDLTAIISNHSSIASSSLATKGLAKVTEEKQYFCFDVQFLDCQLLWYSHNYAQNGNY